MVWFYVPDEKFGGTTISQNQAIDSENFNLTAVVVFENERTAKVAAVFVQDDFKIGNDDVFGFVGDVGAVILHSGILAQVV